MTKQVLFLHGGGGQEDYAADALLVASLQTALGEAYAVNYPFLPSEAAPDLGRLNQINRAISRCPGDLLVVAHSLGASMLLKYLAETETPVQPRITGLFLLATPFWQGEEEWKQGFKLPADFALKLPTNGSIFLYHCRDDIEVPFEHLELYARRLPQATLRPLPDGGHQFHQDLAFVAADIQALS